MRRVWRPFQFAATMALTLLVLTSCAPSGRSVVGAWQEEGVSGEYRPERIVFYADGTFTDRGSNEVTYPEAKFSGRWQTTSSQDRPAILFQPNGRKPYTLLYVISEGKLYLAPDAASLEAVVDSEGRHFIRSSEKESPEPTSSVAQTRQSRYLYYFYTVSDPSAQSAERALSALKATHSSLDVIYANVDTYDPKTIDRRDIRFTPTFVLTDSAGTEIDRLEGWSGEDSLSHLVQQ